MPYTRKPHKPALVKAVINGLASIGTIYPSRFQPVKYRLPYNVDMDAIGKDMWRAIELYNNDKQNQETTFESRR